jgi:hypothetical protein
MMFTRHCQLNVLYICVHDCVLWERGNENFLNHIADNIANTHVDWLRVAPWPWRNVFVKQMRDKTCTDFFVLVASGADACIENWNMLYWRFSGESLATKCFDDFIIVYWRHFVFLFCFMFVLRQKSCFLLQMFLLRQMLHNKIEKVVYWHTVLVLRIEWVYWDFGSDNWISLNRKVLPPASTNNSDSTDFNFQHVLVGCHDYVKYVRTYIFIQQ